ILVLTAVFDGDRHAWLLERPLERVIDRCTIIGMNPVECMATNEFVGRIARESLDRFCDEANRAVPIEPRHPNRTVLDHRAVQALAVRLRMLFCDIDNGADEPARAAILAKRSKRVADPARASIGFEDAILDSIVGTSLDRPGAGGSHTGPVFGMDGV